MYQWFDCHLLGCGGFTEYFLAERRELYFPHSCRLDSSVGRASAFGAGGRGFESRGRTISKGVKIVLAAPLLTLAYKGAVLGR